MESEKISPELKAFRELVATKYQLYNSLFVTLPFENLPEVGAELPVFTELCRTQIASGKNPQHIINTFFKDIVRSSDESTRARVLFLLMQFIERQVVLFDALEDVAFTRTHKMDGEGTFTYFFKQQFDKEKLLQRLKNYRTRIVLTAHPTQFYPVQVLGIIQDLSDALSLNDIETIKSLLLQLGKTSFRNAEKPTPYDEANYLIHHIKYVLYPAIKKIHYRLFCYLGVELESMLELLPLVELGFWPGGDRDGNPYVTSDITIKVAKKLKGTVIGIYLEELKQLSRRLTFPGVWEKINHIRLRLKATKSIGKMRQEVGSLPYEVADEYVEDLLSMRKMLIEKHSGLFVDDLNALILISKAFGFHCASMDVRQDSSAHQEAMALLFASLTTCKHYDELGVAEKIALLQEQLNLPHPKISDDLLTSSPIITDAIGSLKAIRIIQHANGEQGLHRYIISNSQSVVSILEVMLLAHWSGWAVDKLNFDIVPLFETINDLENAFNVMFELWLLPVYKKHLHSRGNVQTVMLGFSDGTKDGGYVSANWAIYQCKKRLTALASQHGVTVVYFDGRGGPPARGGGNTHLFYRAMQADIHQEQIHLTIQGQTISSNFGTEDSAMYNLEQLFTAGLEDVTVGDIGKQNNALFSELSSISFDAYEKLKEHPQFITYLENMTPLKFYGELNVASRPMRRKRQGPMQFSDLRAISFVGAWTQMKQNVPGFYGLGYALKHMCDQNKLMMLKTLYNESLFFHTLCDNAMQSLAKSFFPLTRYLEKDAVYGEFWRLIKNEADLTFQMLQQITGNTSLLEHDSVSRESIQLREELMLPLLIIQQSALMRLREHDNELDRKIVKKSIATVINASRNAV